MHYSVLFAALLLGVTATPVEQRQGPSGEVSCFIGHTNPYTNEASIGYDFTLTGRVSTHCSYSDTTSGVPRVPITPCDNEAVKWEFFPEPAPPGAPYRLVIIYTPTPESPNETYSQALPEVDFPLVTFATGGDGFVYIGEPNFEAYRVD